MVEKKINSYTNKTSIIDGDKLVGTDSTDSSTKNFVMSDIKTYIGTGTVTDSSSTTFTNKNIDADNNIVTNIGSSEISKFVITGQSTEPAPSTADSILLYDASSDSLKKTTIGLLPTGGGGTSSSVYITVTDDGTGDYNTDGTADQTQVNDAIDTANTAGGGTVYVKDGTYSISASIVPKSNVTLIFGDNAVVTRTGSLKMIYTTSAIENVTISGGRWCNDTNVNEIINISSNDNTNIVIKNMHFVKNGGRCIYFGGNVNIFNCYGENVAQGIGTTDISTTSVIFIPKTIIDGCKFVNQNFTGSENEGIDINWHNDSYAMISNCICDGFLENSIEMNSRWWSVSNCQVTPAPTTSGYAFTSSVKVDSGSQEVTGTFSNCHVYGQGSSAGGFFLDKSHGVTAVGCSVTARTAGLGIGYRVSGTTDTTKVLVNGCVAIDLDKGIYNTVGTKCTALAFQAINCDIDIDGTTNIIS
jgi:hypothetical protein